MAYIPYDQGGHKVPIRPRARGPPKGLADKLMGDHGASYKDVFAASWGADATP